MSEKAEHDKSRFDWVAHRSACTLPRVYKTLRNDVGEDVKARNAMRPQNCTYEFSVVDKEHSFSVSLVTADFHREITFVLEDHAILVLDPSGNQMFEVTLNFNSQGKCTMKAKEEFCEPWQVRRMALEDLMFRLV